MQAGCKIMQRPLTGFHQDLHSIFSQGTLWDLGQDSTNGKWNACKIVIEGPSREPTRTKCRDGCASHVKIRTAPQREWSDRHKVLRGLREGYQNSHRATVRAIWHAQSHERLGRAHVRKWTSKVSKTTFYQVSATFLSTFTGTAPATKNDPEVSEVLHRHVEVSACPQAKMTTVSQNETFDPFKTSSKFTKYCACNEKLPPKPTLLLTHACQRFSNM